MPKRPSKLTMCLEEDAATRWLWWLFASLIPFPEDLNQPTSQIAVLGAPPSLLQCYAKSEVIIRRLEQQGSCPVQIYWSSMKWSLKLNLADLVLVLPWTWFMLSPATGQGMMFRQLQPATRDNHLQSQTIVNSIISGFIPIQYSLPEASRS